MTNEILNGEMLNEEQLNEVVGSTRGELSCDTKFLHALGFMDHYYESYYVENHVYEVADEVRVAFNNALDGAFGYRMHIDASVSGNNTYKLLHFPFSMNVTRCELYQKVCEAVGQPDFDYEKYM